MVTSNKVRFIVVLIILSLAEHYPGLPSHQISRSDRFTVREKFHPELKVNTLFGTKEAIFYGAVLIVGCMFDIVCENRRIAVLDMPLTGLKGLDCVEPTSRILLVV